MILYYILATINGLFWYIIYSKHRRLDWRDNSAVMKQEEIDGQISKPIHVIILDNALFQNK